MLVNSRLQKHREALRLKGLRPVQIWVPDTRQADFLDECRRQSQQVCAADQQDDDLQHLMDQGLASVDTWTV